MFQRLQQKWKVGGLQLALILCTFAIGGSFTGLVGKKLMNFLSVNSSGLWLLTYIIIITLVWPMMVLLVSIPFGQYRFFIHYLQKIWTRISGKSRKSELRTQIAMDNKKDVISKKQIINIAIFASGAGSNAQKIIDHFRGSGIINISLIVCNKPNAGVLNIATEENIPVLLIEKEKFFRGNAYTEELKDYKTDLIILAGFLWKIPAALIQAYPRKIINIHPALLPKYGGKGMYGNYVHEAVINAKEKESGITIHYVDEQYDHGVTIFQARCEVLEDDTPASLAQRIHTLEHEHYPKVIESLVKR